MESGDTKQTDDEGGATGSGWGARVLISQVLPDGTLFQVTWRQFLLWSGGLVIVWYAILNAGVLSTLFADQDDLFQDSLFLSVVPWLLGPASFVVLSVLRIVIHLGPAAWIATPLALAVTAGIFLGCHALGFSLDRVGFLPKRLKSKGAAFILAAGLGIWYLLYRYLSKRLRNHPS